MIDKKLIMGMKKLAWIAVLIGILLLPAGYSSLATSITLNSSGIITNANVTALSGSAPDIQAAVNAVAAAGGGTVHIPSGNFTFNIDFSKVRVDNGYAGVQVPSGVNIFGAGNNQTILYCSLSGWKYNDQSDSQAMFILDGTGNKPIRISGIYFQGSMNLTDGADDNRYFMAIMEVNVNNFRIDNNVFINFPDTAIQTTGIWAINPSGDQGLIDHNIIDNPYRDRFLPHNASAPVWALWGYGIILVGDYSTWNTSIAHYLGVKLPLTVYIENNIFNRCRHDIASNGNAFYVSRYNYFSAGYLGANDVHGNAGNQPPAGGRGYESYSNTFNFTDESYSLGQDDAFHIRGGGGVCWNNTIILSLTYPAPASRMFNETVSPYDVEQWYFWNNTVVYSDGTPANFVIDKTYGPYVENVNYFLRAPNQAQDNFTYTPFPYPYQ